MSYPSKSGVAAAPKAGLYGTLFTHPSKLGVTREFVETYRNLFSPHPRLEVNRRIDVNDGACVFVIPLLIRGLQRTNLVSTRPREFSTPLQIRGLQRASRCTSLINVSTPLQIRGRPRIARRPNRLLSFPHPSLQGFNVGIVLPITASRHFHTPTNQGSQRNHSRRPPRTGVFTPLQIRGLRRRARTTHAIRPHHTPSNQGSVLHPM